MIIRSTLLLTLAAFSFIITIYGKANIKNNRFTLPPKALTTDFNKLNWVEVIQNDLSAQIMFDFAQPIYFKKQINKNKSRLMLFFPGMKMKDFNANETIEKIAALKKTELVQDVKIYEKEQHVPLVVVAVTFNQYRTIKTKGSTKKVPNKLIIKWSKIEDPNRLILDIFPADTLKQIREKNSVIFQAQNETATAPFFFKHGRQSQRKPRVIIDPGHGGIDVGSIGYKKTYEKNITLAIAKQVRSLLRSSGINALLTRSGDTYVSLAKRSELAVQLQADLFISIHANSHNIPSISFSGIETFSLDGDKFLPPHGDCGFLYVNTDKKNYSLKDVCSSLLANIDASKQLACCLQHHLIMSLQKNSYTPTDRGTKLSRDRVLLRSQIPAALIEVGFINNPQEAILLSNRKYQSCIAQGIYSGIKHALGIQ